MRDLVISAVVVYAVEKDMLVLDALDSLETDFVILAFCLVTIKSLLTFCIMLKNYFNTF